jgi:hypothetical protein
MQLFPFFYKERTNNEIEDFYSLMLPKGQQRLRLQLASRDAVRFAKPSNGLWPPTRFARCCPFCHCG